MLRILLEEHKCESSTNMPFVGGCIGYISYDLGLELEEIKSVSHEDLSIPHFYFVFYDNLIIFDNHSGKKYISSCGKLVDPALSITKIEERIAKGTKVQYPKVKEKDTTFYSNFTKEEYIKAIGRVKDYIKNGDIYVMNLTQRFTAETKRDSYEIYRDLRNINPAPFAAFMRLDGFDVISSSPERFLRIEKGVVETRPIKGTRPRGRTPEEDNCNRNELLNSDKDKSELLMIVDLERNDLSKVCKPNTVKVTNLYEIEEYSTVFHLVATVKGELEDNSDGIECLKACFPGGSITGTPKIRAMEIIDELEGLKRSLYTGCIGYFSFDGNADFNIVIRTIIKKEDKVYFGVGGGLTWDSVEEEEYQETLDKAKALMRVI
jgi:para-aminobenzoate synthetase component 1